MVKMPQFILDVGTHIYYTKVHAAKNRPYLALCREMTVQYVRVIAAGLFINQLQFANNAPLPSSWFDSRSALNNNTYLL